MIPFMFLCFVSSIFSSDALISNYFESFNDSVESNKDNNKYKKENADTSVTNVNDSYYRDQIQDGYRDRDYDRRMFNWINKIIRNNHSKHLDKQTVPINERSYDEITNFRNIERNLTITLTQLSNVLTQILSIIKYTRHDKFKTLNNALKQTNYDKNRYKRDTNETVNKENDKTNNTKEQETIEKDSTTNDTALEKDGRRTMSASQWVSSEVKERLLHYIQEGFDEIKSKIESLRQTKNLFSKDVNYRIGYIIANLDSLDANMRILNDNLAASKSLWSDTKILSLYDTVKGSTTAVNSLMDVLKKYINTNLN